MDDVSKILFIMLFTGVSFTFYLLAKKAQKITTKTQEGDSFIEKCDNSEIFVEKSQNLIENQDWFSRFMQEHFSVAEFFANPITFHVCKITLMCSCLYLIYQTIQIVPNWLLPIENLNFVYQNKIQVSKPKSSTGIVMLNHSKFHFILTKEQKNNAVFLSLFNECEKKFPQKLVEIFTNESTKFNVRKQILAIAKILGVTDVKLSPGFSVRIPI